MLSKLTILSHLSIFVGTISLMAGCSGNSLLEDRFAADPNLNPDQTIHSNNSNSSPQSISALPRQFPDSIPIYPDASIFQVNEGLTKTQGTTYWQVSDPINVFKSQYQAEFERNNWEIKQPFNPDTADLEDRLIAQNNTLEVTVSLQEIGATNQFIVDYKDLNTIASPNTPLPLTSPSPSPIAANHFSDLADAPAPLQKYLSDLADLGVLTAEKSSSGQFKPNKAITRREYARLLFKVHNQLYVNQPEKQIRPSSETSQPVFSDVSPSDPDFKIIQGLAEAGVLRSSLTGDANQNLFRSDAPLTREDLLIWKVPVDLRKALPTATIDNIKETWGFQDTNKIAPLALRALYADFQNGDKANVRRVFGYTTLFNPNKPVTRAEAAAALWYFGFQGDGISAQEALASHFSDQ